MVSHSNISDREAIAKVKQGRIDYFIYIVRRYSSRVHGYVSRRLYDKDEADDIVQQSFISLYKAIGRVDPVRPLFPYLMQIVKNEMKMFFRKHKDMERLHENIYAEDEEYAITRADIKVGHQVRVRGVWDQTTKKINEVTEIKDFSLPAQ